MRRKQRLPELLAPAGSREALYAAVEGGADAVYVGGKSFNARAYADNFDLEALADAVRYCHLHGVRLYVTVNTLIYDREMDELLSYAAQLQQLGVDALIIADLGAVRRIRQQLPELELHASTQMSVHNLPGAEAAYDMGCCRVVLAREVPLQDIAHTVEHARAECEIFLHGALCVSHSGQCLFSAMVGGRSGNRGECAQPCRLPYNGGHPLSLCDLALAGHIRALIDCGVSSLKIEGRMKSPAYVYGVTRIYRRLLDEGRDATRAELSELSALFSRGGFTDGYLTGHPERRMTGVRSEDDKARTRRLTENVSFSPRPHPVRAEVCLQQGVPARMTLTDGVRRATVQGEIPAPAQRAPLHAEEVKARLCKMGNTSLSLSPQALTLTLDEGINLSPAALNALRREAAAALEAQAQAPLSPAPRMLSMPSPGRLSQTANAAPWQPDRVGYTALFLQREVLETLLRTSPELLSPLDVLFVPLYEYGHLTETARQRVCGVYLPPVLMDSELPAATEALHAARAAGATAALVSNIGAIYLTRDMGFTLYGDFRLNITNRESRRAVQALGVVAPQLSPELTLPMARVAGEGEGGELVLGRQPLMLTERCFVRENQGCRACGHATLTDRRGARFPILREHPHRNLILNAAITYMGDRQQELDRAQICRRHFLFTTETAEEAAALIRHYRAQEPLPADPVCPVRRIGVRPTGKSDRQ